MSRLIIAFVLLLSLTGCDKKSGQAIVIEKEHIAARDPGETPAPTPATTPREEAGDSEEDGHYATLAPDEIAVDQYVMKADARGTSRDPRAMSDEQWLVKVRMVEDGRHFRVHAKQFQFEKLQAGDRVQVSYHIGKYTKTVWAAEIK